MLGRADFSFRHGGGVRRNLARLALRFPGSKWTWDTVARVVGKRKVECPICVYIALTRSRWRPCLARESWNIGIGPSDHRLQLCFITLRTFVRTIPGSPNASTRDRDAKHTGLTHGLRLKAYRPMPRRIRRALSSPSTPCDPLEPGFRDTFSNTKLKSGLVGLLTALHCIAAWQSAFYSREDKKPGLLGPFCTPRNQSKPYVAAFENPSIRT